MAKTKKSAKSAKSAKRKNTGGKDIAPKVGRLDGEAHEENCQFDILHEFMNNEGLKHIADQILSLLDWHSLANCRLVSRAYRDYLDNERSMLQLQIRHFKFYDRFDNVTLQEKYCYYMEELKFKGKTIEERRQTYIENHEKQPIWEFTWEQIGVFSHFESIKDEPTLRTCLSLLRDITSNRSDKLKECPFIYLTKHHRHEELKLLMASPLPMLPPADKCDDGHDGDKWSVWPSRAFVVACRLGCGDCIQIFLDHYKAKDVDLEYSDHESDSYELCDWVWAACSNDRAKGEKVDQQHKKRVVPVLVRFMANQPNQYIMSMNSDTVYNYLRDDCPYDRFDDFDDDVLASLRIDMSDIKKSIGLI